VKEEFLEHVLGSMDLETYRVKNSLEDFGGFFGHAFVATWMVHKKCLG
jgi:hypothetical protein